MAEGGHILALMFLPAIWLIYQFGTEQFGPVPLGGMTYWSGPVGYGNLIAGFGDNTGFDDIPLAPTHHRATNDWGDSARLYDRAYHHLFCIAACGTLRFIASEMVSRLSLIVATVSTIGLIALGATSLDAASSAYGRGRLATACTTPSTWLRHLALLHYLLSPGIFSEQFLMSGMFFWLMVWRVLYRRGLGADVRALAMLAVASCLSRCSSKPAGFGRTMATSRQELSATISPSTSASPRRGRYSRWDF